MKLSSQSFRDAGSIPGRCAFAVMDAKTHVRLSDNRNPELSWSDAPKGTKSFALICVDPDAPTKPDDVNKEQRTVPKSLPRAEFIHWTLADIPPGIVQIPEGAYSQGVTARGKKNPSGPPGSRQGQNDYSGWFAGDQDMDGVYLGYDGPCPPWNDELPHRYRFELYALDLARCPAEGAFTAADLRKAMAAHILAEAKLTGVYTLNPAVKLP